MPLALAALFTAAAAATAAAAPPCCPRYRCRRRPPPLSPSPLGGFTGSYSNYNCPCSDIVLAGATYPQMDGVYSLVENPENSINNGKPVYQHSSGSYYLYFLGAYQIWFVGSDYTSTTALS